MKQGLATAVVAMVATATLFAAAGAIKVQPLVTEGRVLAAFTRRMPGRSRRERPCSSDRRSPSTITLSYGARLRSGIGSWPRPTSEPTRSSTR